MKRILLLAGAAVALALPLPAVAQIAAPAPSVPVAQAQLTPTDRATFVTLFAALRERRWSDAAASLATAPAGSLADYARARLYAVGALAPDAALTTLLPSAVDLPEGPVLVRLAGTGTAVPAQQRLIRLAGPSKREPARTSSGAAALIASVRALVRADDPAGAEALVEPAAAALPAEALTELRERVAWSYYQVGDDAAARRLAALAQVGAGEWSVDAAWVNGLSSWRARQYGDAAAAFARVASNAGDSETAAAGRFWSGRSYAALGQPAAATPQFEAAAARAGTFYGLLAAAALGRAWSVEAAASDQSATLLRHPNLRTAAALAQIGEAELADALIRQQARIGSPAEHCALIGFAASLGLPETQVWLAQNAPAGTRPTLAARFPLPSWTPAGGWRVDRALLLAHALQESEFRTNAVSPAGARGLMQLMPATAQLVARHRGDAPGLPPQLNDPSVNLDYGQSYLEELAASGTTAGLLPKVIAAYNAGPNAVGRWGRLASVDADPLLFIESIPFAETRAYVAIVLRNYWVYQRRTGADPVSLAAMAQGKWPLFPRAVAQVASAAPAAPGGVN